ncbi:wall-associated kinase family protein [Populus alba x Populus x berolinensis]|nr:wall-associated kinase family protein [Populus alba x Populus x berolinensis]
MDRMVWRLVVKMTLLLLMFQLAKAAAPVAKFGCPDRCGAISIPYPFGTRKECYMDERFAIECNDSANPPRAFISRIKMEVLNISVTTATATVKSPVISFNCIGRVDGAPLNLTGTPFVFSSKRNLFVAVGCDTRAFMTGTEPDLVVWESTWGNLQSNVRLQENKMCSGQNCSLARIPSLLQVFNPRLVSTNDNQVGEGCKLAFLVNPTWFESNISDPFAMQYRDYVPMDLGWMMNLNDNDISTHCEEGYNQSECACEDGFEGNPYLELGCADPREKYVPRDAQMREYKRRVQMRDK